MYQNQSTLLILLIIPLFSGGIFTSLGFMGSFLSPSLEYLYLTYGVIVGFGINLVVLAANTIIPHYFKKKLALASGVALTGVAVGLFFFAAVNEYLIQQYGIQGAFLILAAISLHGIPLGMLMQIPTDAIQYHSEIQPLIQDNETTNDGMTNNMVNEIQTCKDGTLTISETEKHEKETKYLQEEHKVQNTHEMALHELKDECNSDTKQKDLNNECNTKTMIIFWLGLDLFQNVEFTLAMISTLLITLPHHVIPAVLPDHILWIGGSTQQATDTLIYIGVANMISRLFIWNLSGQNPNTWLIILGMSSIFSGAALMISSLFRSYRMFLGLSIVFGLLRGLYIIYSYLLVVRIVGKDRTHHGIGINHTAVGIGILIGLAASGIVADFTVKTCGYIYVLLFVGAAEILGGSLYFVMKMVQGK